MAYCSVGDVKEYFKLSVSTDDVLIEMLIGAAQAYIEEAVGFAFEASADTTRTFDAIADVDGYTLTFDTWCCSITSITNGDGISVTSSQYVTEPRNAETYYAVRLKASTGAMWTYSTDPEDAISVTGRWAWSTTADDNIRQACMRLAGWMYRQRENRTGEDDRTIVAGNATILPAAMPSDVAVLLKPYRVMK